MSLFGAMNTAISGLTAQSNAFGNISDNVANSQTVGYKRVDTSFIDYLTTSTAADNDPGAVVARPDYVNNVQGTITQTDNPLGLAIAGQGFFAVSQQTGEANNVADLQCAAVLHARRRLPDGQERLPGEQRRPVPQWLAGQPRHRHAVNQNTLTPIQVTQTVYNPVATSTVTFPPTCPPHRRPTPTTATPLSSEYRRV